MYSSSTGILGRAGPPPQELDYLVVIHCEGTCEQSQQKDPVGYNEQEIIEFTAALVDVKSQSAFGMDRSEERRLKKRTTVEFLQTKEFRSYVRPKKYRVSSFCTTLTGISQKDVDSGDEFPVVLARFHSWLEEAGLLKTKKWAITSVGEFDVVYFLYTTCNIYGMTLPSYYHTFVNLKTLYTAKTTWIRKNPKLSDMLGHFGLRAESRDSDISVLARLCVRMIERGIVFYPNKFILLQRQLNCRFKCVVHEERPPEGSWQRQHAKSMENIEELAGVPNATEGG